MERLTSRDENGNLLLMGEEVYAGASYEAVSALEEYEDAEEQGRLMIFPCKIGNKVYFWSSTVYNLLEDVEIRQIFIKHNGIHFYGESVYTHKYFCESDIGKTIFLSCKEAEKALRESEGKDE